MASSSKRTRSYDVYLNFRGTDVRNNFIGHLYTALDQRRINVYMDSEDLRKTEQISSALMKAIEESQIVIVVFSEDYASSTWCLEELGKIMECKEQRDLIVLPVFYKVEPRVVRGQRESYGQAMARHEVRFGNDLGKVKRWKKALFDAGSLAGWHFTDDRYEAGLIKQIVQEISTQLDRMPLHVTKYPIGIDSRVQELKTILNLQSDEDVLMVGLWGQGGVGKTTLAKAIYNTVFRQFEGSSFLEGIRENSKNSNDLVLLQEKLLSEVLLVKKLTVFNAHGGSQLIRQRLCKKKVLIILDDVDDKRQLNALAGDFDWFAQGSRIIITTRNKHLLTSHGIDSDHLYKVKALKDGEALELFRNIAFLRSQKIEIKSNLVDSVLRYARGLPLALEVLGSFLCGRKENQWGSILEKLAKSPPKIVIDVLKVSYDGLEPYAKESFLDIACFFKGRKTKYIRTVLDSCDFYPTVGVEILIERSLISEEEETLQMPNLTQSMGMDIVKEECHDDPGKRSRLWLYDDVLHVLSGDEGTVAVKAIVLELPERKEMYFGPNAFTKMRKLRLLILRNVHNPFTGPIHLPNELRWFEWPHCASIPKFSHGPKKLVGLDLRNSKIEVGLEQFKDFKKLKFINFSRCQSLLSIPDLDCIPNLEELDLHGCKNLEHLPGVLRSKNLQLLNLDHCSKLQIFPHIPDKIKCLRKFSLVGTSIEDLPASIENLVSLEDMNLKNCKKLTTLPSSIYRLQKLKYLRLEGCSNLIKFPKKEEDSSDSHTKTGFPLLQCLDLSGCNLSEVEFLKNHSCFPFLQSLYLSQNHFTNLPTCKHLSELLWLDVSYCQGLQEIPNIPGKLQYLRANGCKSLSKISSKICYIDQVELSSCHELVSTGLASYNLLLLERFHTFYHSEVLLPGGEMPEWLVPNNGGYISFMASKDLFEKFLGFAFCVVFRVKEGKENVQLELTPCINGKWRQKGRRTFRLDSDHVWLRCSNPWDLWGRDAFGPNDWSHFQYIIRALGGGIVKKCGFRLICKPLENDLEVLLQHNQLLDPALLYKVRDEDSLMSTTEESSNETSAEENSSSNLVLKGSNIADFSIEKHRYSQISSDYRNVIPGEKMPEEFVPIEDGNISFMASQDLYGKFLGLTLCVVIGVEDGKKEISFDIVPHVNGQRRNALSGILGSFDSDHMWIQYLPLDVLWGVLEGGVDFGQFDESYLRFSLRLGVSGGTMKKLGYVLRCRRLENDLKVVLEDNQLVNCASICEHSDDSGDSEFSEHSDESGDSETDTSSPRSRRLLREHLHRCHMHIGTGSQ